jgi:hypothetical protein
LELLNAKQCEGKKSSGANDVSMTPSKSIENSMIKIKALDLGITEC